MKISFSKNIILILLGLSLTSCQTDTSPDTQIGADGSPGQTEEFNFQTIQQINIEVQSDFSNVEFEVFDEKNKLLASINTDNSGLVKMKIPVSYTSDKLILRTNYIGLPSEVEVTIKDYSATIDLREEAEQISSAKELNFETFNFSSLNKRTFPEYKFLSSWDQNGVPVDLLFSKEITKELIKELNIILPELKPVPEFRPQYLDETLDNDIHVTKDGEVFVTFVHEGAGYKNSLAFYTYETKAGPPSQVADDDITLIFPNVSYRNSGGGLNTGDTVKIGYFSAGTSIGWVLISNAYNNRYGAVTNGINKFYSENNLNPDKSPHQQHFIQIALDDKIILGIEDLLRPDGDNDFNDAVFTVSSNPIDAIDKNNLITNTDENFNNPQEETKPLEVKNTPLFDVSGYQYFPGKNEFGTLAFEDLWPHKGDYDFNDLVIDYNIIEALDKDNKIIQIQISLKITGILASMHNGFGIQLGISPEVIASVDGTKHTKGYTDVEPNGTEKRQEKAVIIAFEDAQAHYNTSKPDDSELIVISINLLKGVERAELGYAPYNPFIMSNGERGREVHLPGYQPTSLVHIPYFGSVDDDSVVGTTYTYKTDNDLPWAINLPEKFYYPHDSVEIYKAYNLFNNWVDTDGFSYSDWYTDKPDYRVPKYIKRE